MLEVDLGVHAKQRHTAQRLFDRLRAEEGYTGGLPVPADGQRGTTDPRACMELITGSGLPQADGRSLKSSDWRSPLRPSTIGGLR